MDIRSGAEKSRSGTTISITCLHFRFTQTYRGILERILRRVLLRSLKTAKVAIKVNAKWCEPEPLMLKTEYHPPDGKEEFRLRLEAGNEVGDGEVC